MRERENRKAEENEWYIYYCATTGINDINSNVARDKNASRGTREVSQLSLFGHDRLLCPPCLQVPHTRFLLGGGSARPSESELESQNNYQVSEPLAKGR